MKFEGVRVFHVVDSTSDHCALFLTNSPPQCASNAKMLPLRSLVNKKLGMQEHHRIILGDGSGLEYTSRYYGEFKALCL